MNTTPETLSLLLSKHIGAEPAFRWTAELEYEGNIRAARPTWQEARAALIEILLQLGRIESAAECRWQVKTYRLSHQDMHTDDELRGFKARKMVLRNFTLTGIRDSHIENCPECLNRLKALGEDSGRIRLIKG